MNTLNCLFEIYKVFTGMEIFSFFLRRPYSIEWRDSYVGVHPVNNGIPYCNDVYSSVQA